ncbi:hypothetical protein LDENG_00166010 [Lucifuga dentata]|nr:hypothetical protein LDENG_00166010 [Lucifuga dentata]
MEQWEHCEEQLRKVAQELESLRQNCNGFEWVGSSVAVVSTACWIGAGVATLCTGGAAAPFLGMLGTAYAGTGDAINVGTKITEHFLSSSSMKEAVDIKKKSSRIEENIKKLFKHLKQEREDLSSEEVDQHVMTEVVEAVARRRGFEEFSLRAASAVNEPKFYFGRHFRTMCDIPDQDFHDQSHQLMGAGIIALLGVLTFFTLTASRKQNKVFFGAAAKELLKQMTNVGVKTATTGLTLVRVTLIPAFSSDFHLKFSQTSSLYDSHVLFNILSRIAAHLKRLQNALCLLYDH